MGRNGNVERDYELYQAVKKSVMLRIGTMLIIKRGLSGLQDVRCKIYICTVYKHWRIAGTIVWGIKTVAR